mgnify:CR=1 FL=1
MFNYGDEGDRFYLVVEGTAAVYVPVLAENCDPLKYIDSSSRERKFSRKNILKMIANFG